MAPTQPSFASALSTAPKAIDAVRETVAELERQLGGEAPDLLLAFSSAHHVDAAEELASRLASTSGAAAIAGCSGASIVGGAREVEQQPALSLWAARLPGTRVRVDHFDASMHDKSVTFSGSPRLDDPERAGIVLFGDPFSFPMQPYLSALAGEFPGVPICGGMASGGLGPGQCRLFHDAEALDRGALAITVEGDVELRPIVSQGCRPIGKPLVITACEQNEITGLRGRPATKLMFKLIEELDPDERSLFKRGAFVGIATDATKSDFQASDLLVRNIVGINPQRDSIAVADGSLRPGQTLCFMVRDASSASEELTSVLERRGEEWMHPGFPRRHAGALLFTCGGRGSHMFGAPDHDASAIQRVLGPDLPTAGFFANGEIGPVGDRAYLHGFTASIALFRSRTPLAHG